MTFLEIAQAVARESGTVGTGVKPLSVSGQTGPLLDIVEWVKSAWRDIQNKHSDWRFLEGEYTGSLSAGTREYSAADFGLTRHAAWIASEKWQAAPVTAYRASQGVSDQQAIFFRRYDDFRAFDLMGTPRSGRPSIFTITPSNTLMFGPIPDEAYTVVGTYKKAAQTLFADADMPDCPERFHEVIVDKALMFLHMKEEAAFQYQVSERRYRERMDALEDDQLPPVYLAGALA